MYTLKASISTIVCLLVQKQMELVFYSDIGTGMSVGMEVVVGADVSEDFTL